jgi:D-alanine-D-alanine ligase
MDQHRPLIAVIRGGYTGESVISMQSAATMMGGLDTRRFDAVYLTVGVDGMSCETPAEQPLPIDRGTFSVDRGNGPERIAAALIAIHGSPGEDGILQGYLDLVGAPYQTGGVLNMAMTMSKYSTVALLRDLGFPVAPSIRLHASDLIGPHALEGIGYPCFVKPDQSGSSLGVAKVKTPDELHDALAAAFRECTFALVERGVAGRELTCGVLISKGQFTPLPVCEISTTREFFDYEAKYHAADTRETIPADLPGEVTRLVQDRSAAIARALDCRGMVRVDHMWTGTELITIEVNTVPGFSPASIYPKMLEAAGLGVSHAVNLMVDDMLARTARKCMS